MCTSHPELKGLLALMFCVLIKEAAVNGCSLPCLLATRYLNTYNQGGGGVLLISGISACHSRFFYSSKRNVVFCFFFHGESKVGNLFALMISQMGSDVLT